MKSSPKLSPAAAEPAESEIQHCAYFLWQEKGRPENRDLDLWLEARERLRHQAKPPQKARRRKTVA